LQQGNIDGAQKCPIGQNAISRQPIEIFDRNFRFKGERFAT